MKKVIFAIAITLLTATAAFAQERERPKGHKPSFSHEEFKAKQRAFITEKAELTPQEAEAFFPLFFELQKKKFETEHSIRKEMRKPRGEKFTEEQCREFVYKMADTKIEISKLEREYIDKYLAVISASKLHKIQHAEGAFQRHLMKEMTKLREERKNRD